MLNKTAAITKEFTIFDVLIRAAERSFLLRNVKLKRINSVHSSTTKLQLNPALPRYAYAPILPLPAVDSTATYLVTDSWFPGDPPRTGEPITVMALR
jgi:hypothetical protein